MPFKQDQQSVCRGGADCVHGRAKGINHVLAHHSQRSPTPCRHTSSPHLTAAARSSQLWCAQGNCGLMLLMLVRQ